MAFGNRFNIYKPTRAIWLPEAGSTYVNQLEQHDSLKNIQHL